MRLVLRCKLDGTLRSNYVTVNFGMPQKCPPPHSICVRAANVLAMAKNTMENWLEPELNKIYI